MEANQINIFAFTVLGNLEQIDDAKEARLSRQLRSDIRETDRRDRIDFNLTFFHAVPGSHFHMGAHPYSDTASDFSATDSLTKPLSEHHEEIIHAQGTGFEHLHGDLG